MQWRWILTASRCRYGLQISHHSLRDLEKLELFRHPPAASFRAFHSNPGRQQDVVALRKELKDEQRASRAARRGQYDSEKVDKDATGDWRLTVGVEIHAQLNTARKLFSGTRTSPLSITDAHPI